MSETMDNAKDLAIHQKDVATNDETTGVHDSGVIEEIVTEKDKAAAIATRDNGEEGRGPEEETVESPKDDVESVAGATESKKHPPINSKPNENAGTETEKNDVVTYPADENKEHKMADTEPGKVWTREITVEKGDVQGVQCPTSTQASGLVQILSLLWKNFLTKMRTPLATFFEFLSPLLMMLILAAAYQLSEIEYRDAATYASLSFDLPGPWWDILNPQTIASLTQSVPTRRRSLLEFDPRDEANGELLDERSEKLFGWLDGGLSHKLKDGLHEHASSIRRLQTENGQGGPVERDNARDAYSFLDDARQQIAQVLQSPTAIPSFDTFAGLSIAISQLVGVETLPRVFADSSFGRQWGNLLTLGTLHLSPNNSFSDSFWGYLNRSYPLLMETGQVKVRIHETEGAALQFINENLDERTWALLDFTRCSFEDEDHQFKIRLNYTTVPNTNEVVNYVSIGLNSDYQMYYLSGFLTLQRTVNEFIFSETDQCTGDLSSVWSMPMPTAAYSQNPFFLAVGSLLGLTIVMAYLYPTSRLVKTVVEEKESRMRETLFMLGLRGWAHWLSWFLTALSVFGVVTVTVTVSLTATVLQYSDPAYIFAFIGLFSTATIGLCFTLSSLFSKAKLAAIMAPVVLFATILPRFIFFGFNRYEATTGMVIASLFPATAFAFGADIVADYEYSEQGIQSWNASEGDYSFNTTLGMLLVDTFLYLFLGFYFDQVIPRQYGTSRPLYFFLLPSYWRSVFGLLKSRTVDISLNDGSFNESGSNFESVHEENLIPRVFIENLVKQYKKTGATIPPAIDHLNLTLYENQITAMLGHNGAGKTSTVSVLTGLFPPTSGDCVIYGSSIVHDIQGARQSIGICPQHNVLFDSLTVAEHLIFFMKIKGLRPSAAAVQQHAAEIGLTDFLSTRSASLSGGNKRKLSVAIALCADPKCLILDEPTSAMDPHSRRAVWELLRAKRKGRVTLLTTHFLDEAEILCDRIAVMKAGKLQCSGSPNFLKERFGLGYNLTVVLEPKSLKQDGGSEKDQDEPLDFTSQLSGLSSVVQEVIPGTELIRVSGKEVTYRIPRGSERLLPDLFDRMEAEAQTRGVGAFGVRDSSLEEIFLQLAEESDEEEGDFMAKKSTKLETYDFQKLGNPRCPNKEDPERSSKDCESISSASNGSTLRNGTSKASGEDLSTCDLSQDLQDLHERHRLSPIRQIGLLYWKRFVVQRRDVKGFCFAVIVPLIVITLVLLVLIIEPPYVGSAIEISPTLYNEVVGARSNTGVAIGTDSESSHEFESISSSLVEQYPFVEVSGLVNATSQDLSEYLLETYNARISPPRFGALALDDVVDVSIRIDWDILSRSMEDFGFDISDLVQLMAKGGASFASLGLTSFVEAVGDLSSFDDVDADLAAIDISSQLMTLGDMSLRNATNAFLSFMGIKGDTLVTISQIDRVANVTLPRYTGAPIQAVSLDDLVTISLFKFVNITFGSLPSDITPEDLSLMSMVDFFNFILGLLAPSNSEAEVLSSVALFDFLNSTFGPFASDVSAEELASMTLGTLLNSTLGPATIELSLDEWSSVTLFTLLNSTFGPLPTNANIGEVSSSTVSSLLNATIGSIPAEDMNLNDIADIPLGALLNASFGPFPAHPSFEDLLSSTIETIINTTFVDAEELSMLRFFDILKSNINLMEVLTSLSNRLQDSFQLNSNGLRDLFPEGVNTYVLKVQTRASILHNSSSPHAVAAFNQAFANYLYQSSCSVSGTARLASVNEPLPMTQQQSIEVQTMLSILAAIFLLIPFGYIPGAFIVFLVKERITKSKHLQLVSGVNMTSYWLSQYIWDLTLFAILTFCVMMIFLMFGKETAAIFVGDAESFFATMTVIFGYGCSVLPFSYLFARKFDNPGSAQISVVGVLFITGFVAVNAYFIMTSIETTEDAAESLLPLFRMWPGYLLGESFIQLASAFWEREILFGERNPFDWDVTGKTITLLYCLAPVYFLLLLMLEYAGDGGSGGWIGRGLRRIRGSYDRLVLSCHGVHSNNGQIDISNNCTEGTSSDEDVLTEEEYVNSTPGLEASAPILMKNLWKAFPPSGGCRRRRKPRLAVRGLSVAIHQGETFGLLGSNGAGKSTTLAMLTSDIAPTSGEAYISKNDITGTVAGGVAKARQSIGLCPQTDPLLDLMTGRETLKMFARLRGVGSDSLDGVVSDLIVKLTLQAHADKTTESYSGGNKRKLSLGIAALVGECGVLLIDECSSGLDPMARRKLWELIEHLALQRSVVITTHSMEEAEALCSRVGIMAHGRFVALGTVQHLKSKFLDGYNIEINCRPNTPEHVVDALVSEVLTKTIPGSTIAERHGRFVTLDVPRMSSIGLGVCFRRMQELKESVGSHVENYSMSQCSLEQVFIKLVKDANESEFRSEPGEKTPSNSSDQIMV